MRKREYTKKQMAAIILLSIGMLTAAAILNQFFPSKSRETSTKPANTSSPTPAATAAPTPEPDPTERVATFLQGPKSWKARRLWSGEWGKEFYDGGSFGGFGCGLCCMANIYCTLTDYRCSPIDMYEYAKESTEYEGGSAIDWGYIKTTLRKTGFQCDVWRKPSKYENFRSQIEQSMATIVVVSSNDSDCYWKDTPGHYVTLFLYDKKTDRVFLADSGNPNHNRHWVDLNKIYRSLKKSNRWQYLSVTAYKEKKDKWKHRGIYGNCIVPDEWESSLM